MVIWSEFRMWQYRDHDHREDAPHFTIVAILITHKARIYNDVHIEQNRFI